MNAKHFEVILYKDDGWTAQRILTILKAWAIVEIYAFILHDMDTEDDGSPKKPHYHVYIGFGKTATSIQSTANRFKISDHLVQKIKTPITAKAIVRCTAWCSPVTRLPLF